MTRKMMREGQRTWFKILGTAFLCTLPLLTAACGGKQDAVPANAVQVVVTDSRIELPSSLPSGATTFEVINAGHQPHSFAVTGPAGDTALDKPLQPGETGTLKLNLDAGTYRIYTPVDLSQGEPMQVALNVRPALTGHRG